MTNMITKNENLKVKSDQKGFAQIILVFALVLGIVVLSATSYYLLKAQGKAPVGNSTLYNSPTPVETPVAKTEIGAISNSTDTKTIESEINSTDLDSIDSDLNDLLGSANSI